VIIVFPLSHEVHGELKQAHMKVLKQSKLANKELERPVPELLAVMCMCNKASKHRKQTKMGK
jgi:hypothetical protein